MTTICVNKLPGIATVTGPKDLPEVNSVPKVETIPPFCLKPKIVPYHPSPHLSLIVIVKLTLPAGVGVGGDGDGAGVGFHGKFICMISTQYLKLQSLLLLI